MLWWPLTSQEILKCVGGKSKPLRVSSQRSFSCGCRGAKSSGDSGTRGSSPNTNTSITSLSFTRAPRLRVRVFLFTYDGLSHRPGPSATGKGVLPSFTISQHPVSAWQTVGIQQPFFWLINEWMNERIKLLSDVVIRKYLGKLCKCQSQL